MNPTILLATAPGLTPYETIDITDKAPIIEAAPRDNDAVVRDYLGMEDRFLRSMQRRLRIVVQDLTNNEVNTLRRWKHERKRIMINPNYNDKTILYQRFNRSDPADFNPGVTLGVAPTFVRAVSGANASATFFGQDGLYHLLDASVPRYDNAVAAQPWSPLRGIQLVGDTTQLWGDTSPTLGSLEWTLTDLSGNASWAWDANADSIIADLNPGAALFIGDSGDYIERQLTSMGSPASWSTYVWIRGEGRFEYEIGNDVTGGPLGTGAITLNAPATWTQLKLEHWTRITGATFVTFRIYSRENDSWCNVSHQQLEGNSRVTPPIHNTAGTARAVTEDGLEYPIFPGNFGPAFHIGLQTPLDWVQREQNYVFSADLGSGDELFLRYDITAGKWQLQRKASAHKVEWTPVKSGGQPTVISVLFDRGTHYAYENGVFQGLVVTSNTIYELGLGVRLGASDITNALGLNSLLFFFRIDTNTALDTAEMTRISNLYNNDDQLYWTKILEGREFRITSPEHRIIAGNHKNRLTFDEVRSVVTATTEDA